MQELSEAPEGSQPLRFDTKYSRNYAQQFRICLWKNYCCYWCAACCCTSSTTHCTLVCCTPVKSSLDKFLWRHSWQSKRALAETDGAAHAAHRRSPEYNSVRILFTTLLAFLFGARPARLADFQYSCQAVRSAIDVAASSIELSRTPKNERAGTEFWAVGNKRTTQVRCRNPLANTFTVTPVPGLADRVSWQIWAGESQAVEI